MPRKFMFTKDEILNAALNLTREKGFSAVTARALGEQLGTSSRPVFSHFENMADVQKAVIAAANEVYHSYLEKDIASGKYPPYKASGMAYIRFAKEEKELFKLLFMRDRSQEEKEKQGGEEEQLIDLVCRQVRISRENAYMFHLEMWVYVHGIATMIATNYLDWDDDFASRALTDVYIGLKCRYENKTER